MRYRSLIAAMLLLAGCGGGGSGGPSDSGSSNSSSSPPPANVLTVTVGPGPTAAASNVNIPYVTVTVCAAGTSHCAAIDHVLLDTGSWGLRLMSSVLTASGVSLPNETDGAGNLIGECTPFAAGYASGAVALADVTLAGESASNVPVQVIDDSQSSSGLATHLPCQASLNTVGSFDANGVLGVGLFVADCGNGCAQVVNNGVYFKCSASLSCSATTLPVEAQVTNPVALFANDNNGVIVSLPAISGAGAARVTGSLIFGIGTQTNNGLGATTVLPADVSNGRIVVVYGGKTLTDGFMDSGSNSTNFADASIPACSGSSGFYCPPTTLSLTATSQGTNGTQSTVTFTVANFQTLYQNNRSAYAFNDIGGSTGSNTFDWGLPFFFGRSVYTGIEGRVTPGGPTGPYYAY